MRSVGSVLCVMMVASAWAGPLDPPVGPIAPTHKTLTEVEPRTVINLANTPGDADSTFRITQPGSYYLAANLFASAGKHGIEIANDNVTIDLNGFALLATGTGLDGITTAGINRNNVAIRNGVCAFWGNHGIDIDGEGTRIERVRVRGNTTGGIRVDSYAVVIDCQAISNIGMGIAAGSACIISRCIASENTEEGITTAAGCVIEGCTAELNGNFGIIGHAAAIHRCAARRNADTGFYAGEGSTISDCAADENLDGGFSILRASMTRCTASENAVGFYLSGCSVVEGCVAYNNDDISFRLASEVTLRSCSSDGSLTDAHIRVAGHSNMIDGNRLRGSGTGVFIPASTNNTVVGNISMGLATPWNITGDNYYGQMVDRRVPETLPSTTSVNGFTAASTLGTTSPYANIAY